MTMKQFLARARALRRDADVAERRLFDFLHDAEGETFWRESGRTFEELLRAENICEPSRYTGYRQARQLLGDVDPDVGVAAVIAAGRMKRREQAQDVIDQAKTWEATNGTAISQQSADCIGKEVQERAAGVRNKSAHYSTLSNENDFLREEVAKLRTMNAALKKELRAYKTENAKLRKAAGARAAA